MDVIDLIEEGENLYENGDSSAAKSKFLKASLLAPEDPQIYNRLGMLEMSRASPDQARIFYQKACPICQDKTHYLADHQCQLVVSVQIMLQSKIHPLSCLHVKHKTDISK